MKYLKAVRYFFIPLFPLLGLPLLGWGIGDIRGFLSDLPRLGYVLAATIPGLAEAYYVMKAGERNNLSKGKQTCTPPTRCPAHNRPAPTWESFSATFCRSSQYWRDNDESASSLARPHPIWTRTCTNVLVAGRTGENV
jgi:hypothetical protein